MNIVISYHNFVRDYRGSLLLKSALESLGHAVWITPHWGDDIGLSVSVNADVIIGCQIAERSVSRLGYFAKETGVHLVLNSSEQFTNPSNYESFITFDCNKLNSDVISFQSIANPSLFDYIQNRVGAGNSEKYRLIGFPRHDFAVSPFLNTVEVTALRENLNIPVGGRVFLFLSSFLFADTFRDVPSDDMKRWSYSNLVERNEQLWTATRPLLTALLRDYLRPNDVLVVKRHPWDLSSRLASDLNRDARIRFLSNHEYIVPSIGVADVVLHNFSTASIEAWLMKKPTIALLPDGCPTPPLPDHMQYEIRAKSCDSLLNTISSYPQPSPSDIVHSFLGGLADGMATVRLAEAVDRLPLPDKRANSHRSLRRVIRSLLHYYLREIGLTSIASRGRSARNSQNYEWERYRRRIKHAYRLPIIDHFKNCPASGTTRL